MSLTNDELAFKNATEKNCSFSAIDRDCGTYWEIHEEKDIMQYGFDSPVNLISNLNDYIPDSKSRIIAMSTFKQRTQKSKGMVADIEDNELPEYVYNF